MDLSEEVSPLCSSRWLLTDAGTDWPGSEIYAEVKRKARNWQRDIGAEAGLGCRIHELDDYGGMFELLTVRKSGRRIKHVSDLCTYVVCDRASIRGSEMWT
jgi:hypothetical protein